MRSRFLKGLVWGSVIGSVVGAIMSPMVRPHKKPLVERSTDAIRHTTKDLLQGARRARTRILKRLD